MMLIPEQHISHWIDHFYGYGSWDARFWFVGHEEGGGDLPEEVAEKLEYFADAHSRAKEPTLCDIRELYKRVGFKVDGPRSEKFATLFDHRFEPKAVLHGLWKNLIAFSHGYDGKKLPDLLPYQLKKFVSSTGNEALIQLYPMPSPHAHAWYYAWLDAPAFPFLKSRAQYQEHLYEQRMLAILKMMRLHKPALVMMYGMENINGLKQSVQSVFTTAKFNMVKGVKLKSPQYHRADVEGMTLLITTQMPTLRHNRIETGFDWYGFGGQVKKN